MKFLLLSSLIFLVGCEMPKPGTVKITNNSGEDVWYNLALSNESVMLTKVNQFNAQTPLFPLLKEGQEVTLNFEEASESYSIALVDVYAIRENETGDSMAVNLLTLSVMDIYGIWFIEIPELSDE